MTNLNEYLDKLSLVKVLSFFLLIILIMTLITMVFNIGIGSLLFKLILYGVMLVFFVYKLKSVSLEDSDNSFYGSLKDSYKNIFKSINIYQILFIIIANVLFVSMIFFILRYFSILGFFQFDAYLFGNLSVLSPKVVFIYFLSVVILSPIVEEILFRGIILRRFNEEFGLNKAILISSIFFGLCHSFGGILGAILFGVCASILYIKTRNILVPIFAHFLNNLLSFCLAFTGVEFFIYANDICIYLVIVLAILVNFLLFRAIFNEWPSNFI